jgi:cobalt-zinc-cadmium efflux system outer membrane protein
MLMILLLLNVILFPVSTACADVDYADESGLAALIWEHAQNVIDARKDTMVAGSEVTRARLYPNPTLDAGWNTIPVGSTNPSALRDPLGNVPNYTVGLSELLELAKRGPRQAAAAAELEAAHAHATAVFADRFFEVLRTVGRIATSQVRESVLAEQVGESTRLLALSRARAEKGEIAPMHVERAETEHARLEGARDKARTEVEAARADCAELLAAPCPPFASGADARAFLHGHANASLPSAWSPDVEERRPDVASLAAALRAADEQGRLAKRKSVPDVTVRLGYTYDTFVASGNQRQSLGLGVQLPLPVLDQGQADREAAEAAMLRARRAREALVASGRLVLESAVRQRAIVGERIARIAEALARADQLRTSMQGAVEQGGMSQVDVLLARRRYQELLLEGVDLESDAYETALKIRQIAAVFPRPETSPQEPNR